MRTGLLLTVTDVLTSWGHHALKSLNPSLHYILAKLFVNLHIIFESMDGTLCSYHLNETSFAGFVQSLEFLKKSWNLSSNFLDLEKVWKMRWSLRKLSFFFSKLQQMLYKWIFFTFVKSYSISSICLQHTMKKALLLDYKIGDQ